MSMEQQIEAIRRYTEQHPDLHSAHHFCFDLKAPPAPEFDAAKRFVVMGINPGEMPEEWTKYPVSKPTETTSLYRFRPQNPSESAWNRDNQNFLRSSDVYFAEAFFWSSREGGKEASTSFKGRWGPFAKSPHLSFCRDLNRSLLNMRAPNAVIFWGISYHSTISKIYQLNHIETLKIGNANLVRRYHDPLTDTPWFFCRHLTGKWSRPSPSQKEEMRKFVFDHLKAR